MLKRLREKAGKTQREMAVEVGVTERTYIRWEHGDSVPDSANLLRLADILGVDPHKLVGPGVTA